MIDAGAFVGQFLIMLDIIALVALVVGASGVLPGRQRRCRVHAMAARLLVTCAESDAAASSTMVDEWFREIGSWSSARPADRHRPWLTMRWRSGAAGATVHAPSPRSRTARRGRRDAGAAVDLSADERTDSAVERDSYVQDRMKDAPAVPQVRLPRKTRGPMADPAVIPETEQLVAAEIQQERTGGHPCRTPAHAMQYLMLARR